MRRGKYVIIPNVNFAPWLITHVGKELVMCHPAAVTYDNMREVKVPKSVIQEASVLVCDISREMFKQIKHSENKEFYTKLSKTWDLAANYQYDFILVHAKNVGTLLISYKHISRVRQTTITATSPGKTLTHYEYKHKFFCKEVWETDTRALLCASR